MTDVPNTVDSIKWGAEIRVDGVRPKWLADDVPMKVWNARRMAPMDGLGPEGYEWTDIQGIVLPAENPAYLAISKGFEPWGGGDKAPEDWDGGEVLVNDTHARILKDPGHWNWAGSDWHAQIIGYRKRTTPPNTVTIPRMTEEEAEEWIMQNSYIESRAHIIHAFRQLGLIIEPTPTERLTSYLSNKDDLEDVLALLPDVMKEMGK